VRSTVFELLGDWRLCATTSGFFDSPRIDSAALAFSEVSGARVRMDVRFLRAGRIHEIVGMVDTRPGKSGLFKWRGRGARLIVAQGWWGVRVSTDSQLALLRYPGTWMSGAGAVLLARADVESRTLESLTAARAGELGLSSMEITTLGWRR
jgi:hypothetical protein